MTFIGLFVTFLALSKLYAGTIGRGFPFELALHQ